MYTWQPLYQNTWSLDQSRRKIQTLLNCLSTHWYGPMSLHYVIFGHGGNLLRRHVHILKDPPISFLPEVPHDVYANSIEASAFLVAVCSHQVASEAGSCWGSCTAKFFLDNTWSQTTRAKGHNSERCSPLSRGPLQTAQCSWCGHSLFWRLSAIRILSCSKI
jgi:hypothetical protein